MTRVCFSRGILGFVLAWIVSVIVSAAIGSAMAQRGDNPTIISGSDIGFRVEKVTPSGGRAGRLIVRVDGRWVDAELAPSIRPAR